jgi:hypothetical protein
MVINVSQVIRVLAAGLVLSISAVAAEADAVFAGVWAQKEPNGIGGIFVDQSWENLVSHWKELGSNQYLTDVEVYRRNGQWRFAAVWRIGPGNGALFLTAWPDFAKKVGELKETQDLIDVEIFLSETGWKYLGVWRHKQGRNRGSGAFLSGLTWDELVARWKELGRNQYLAKVESYAVDGKRLFAGIWRVGSGNGALYLNNDWKQFAEVKRNLNATQEMLDFEMFPAEDGGWRFLGVWRQSGRPAGPLHASQSNDSFRPLAVGRFLDQWDRSKAAHTLIDIAIATPAIPRGDTSCKYGDVDCNRCANNVAQQFQQAFETGHRPWVAWRGGSWSFSGDTRYPPDNSKPEDAFNRFGEGSHVGLPDKHIQGLVRTNSSRYPYAGSHSHRDKGSVFFIRVDNGKFRLDSIHRANNDHPSGVAVLGDGLYVGEDDRLRWFGISASIDNQDHGYVIPKTLDPRHKGLQGAGGGLGLAKLQDRTYLLVVTARGDGFRPRVGVGSADAPAQNLEHRYTRFYRIIGSDAGHPDDIQFLGEYENANVSRYPGTPLAYSENLSLVTECGTGHLYTIHTTGQYLLNGDGYWRLSRVETGPDGPRLRHLAIEKQAQRQDECHHRSSATVHVNRNGELEFLCSERSVVRMNPGTFNFKEGTR